MDEQFVESAMNAYGNTVLRCALSVTGNKPDAEDIFSDVFFALFKHGGMFSGGEHLKAWLLRLTLNKSKNLQTSRWKTKRVPFSENIPASENDPEYDVPTAMQKLEPDDRLVLYLHYYEGYSYREIATIFTLREGSVRSKAARARERLKVFLSD